MGCFNVACSVSKISITHGDDVVFIPLIHKNYKCTYSTDHQAPRIMATNHLIGYDAYYQAFCLPIYAKYDHYGSIDSIVQDANTEALERKIGLPLDVVFGANHHPSPYSRGKLSALVIPNWAEIAPEREINEKVLTLLGFIKGEDNIFTHPQVGNFKIKLKPGTNRREWDSEILNEKNEVVWKNAEHDFYTMEKVLDHFSHLSNFYPGVEDRFQEIVDTVKHLAGMFIDREVYEELTRGKKLVDAKEATPFILEQLGFTYKEDCPRQGKSHGFKIYTHPLNEKILIKASDRYSASFIDENREEYIHSVIEMRNRLKKDFHLELDLTPLMTDSKYSPEFEEMRKSQSEAEPPSLPNEKRIREYVEKLHQEQSAKGNNTVDVEAMVKMMMVPRDYSPFAGYLHRYFPSNDYFIRWYKDSVVSGEIKKPLLDYIAAVTNMIAMNTFLFPAMNGYQDGDHRATKRILEKALEVVNNKLAREEGYEVDED